MKENSSTILEKGTWPYSSSNSFSCSSNNNGHIDRASGCANEENMTSNCLDACSMASIGDEMFDGDPVLIDHTAKVDSDSYHYSLTQPVDDLSFMDSEQVEKANGDFMFYNWPEIESFEDIDKMFRSCDSTFGFGVNNVDDLGWLSSANGPEEPDDPLKPSLEIPSSSFATHDSASENDGVSRPLDNVCPLPDETNKDVAPNSETSSSKRSDANDSFAAVFSSCDGQRSSFFIDDTQNISFEAQLETQNPKDVEKEDTYQEKGEAFVHLDKVNQLDDMVLPMDESSCQSIFSSRSQQKHQNEFQNCLRSQNPPGSKDPSNPVLSISVPSMVKSEDNVQLISQKKSSDAVNRMLSVQSIHGLVEHKTKGFELNGFSASTISHEMGTLISDPVIAQNQVSSFESGIEGQSECTANGLTSFPAEFDPSNLQESSCLSSGLDEVSLEASSFRQLQNVMEKLDIKTKLCIRDSLYRLARSAEQKHKCTDRRSGIRFDKDGSEALAPDETDKGNGLMDMEADTNPIDRSIAHLLFHRPSYSSKPLMKAHKSNNAPAPVIEKPTSLEESNGAVAK